MTTNRRHAAAALILSLTAAVLLSPAAAHADPPERLTAQVIDRVGALDDRRAAVDTALSKLTADTGLQLFVVFVDSFDGTSAQTWADQTARLSDLGDRDALLAVATGDRSYAYSFDSQAELTDAQLEEVAQEQIEPALGRDDWAGAVIGAADGYRAAVGGGADGVSGVALLLCLLVPLGAIVLGAFLWRRSRRARRTGAGQPQPVGGYPPQPQAAPPAAPQPADPYATTATEELSNQANTLLLELDDDLRTSERELTLATGQYGPEETAAFRGALESARQEVAEAFRLRLGLDERPPPDEAALRSVLIEIIRRCEQADARLDAESEAFDRLRDIEGRVEEVAAEVEREHTAVEADLPAVVAVLGDLTSRYAGATVAAVAGNVDQARERLAFATEAVRRAREAVTADDRPEAALAVRAAWQAVDQAEQLVAAVRQTGTDLAAADLAVTALISEVRNEVAMGRDVLTKGGEPANQAALTSAMQQAEVALGALGAGPFQDPVAAVRQLQEVDAALDRALADARGATDRTARARELLAQALPVARAEVAAAGGYVTTRRGAVAGQARAWLAEAHRHLAMAESLAETDPVTALAEAQQAHHLAASAAQSARDDVDRWTTSGGYAGADPMGAFAGALLGGILSGGGRSHHGGWGGGFGGGGFSGGGWSGGGFGGSGGRGRRTGGGGFGGGGGRRGGGGRF